jgi:hypothetical protein
MTAINNALQKAAEKRAATAFHREIFKAEDCSERNKRRGLRRLGLVGFFRRQYPALQSADAVYVSFKFSARNKLGNDKLLKGRDGTGKESQFFFVNGQELFG